MTNYPARAMRPRSADSFRKIYRHAAKVAKERGGDGIADRGSKGPRASCPHLFLISAADCRKRSAFGGSRPTRPMELALHFDDEVFVHD